MTHALTDEVLKDTLTNGPETTEESTNVMTDALRDAPVYALTRRSSNESVHFETVLSDVPCDNAV